MVTKRALQLSAIVMLRPGSFIRAEWSEVDFDNAVWTIDIQHMKADTMIKKANRAEDRHIIPLPDQAVDILKSLIPLTGHSRYVFQSPATRKGVQRPLSKDTVLRAIYRMGFQGEMSAHGFRSMASTLLNDMRRPDGSRLWDRDAIERQLSHKDSKSSA